VAFFYRGGLNEEVLCPVQGGFASNPWVLTITAQFFEWFLSSPGFLKGSHIGKTTCFNSHFPLPCIKISRPKTFTICPVMASRKEYYCFSVFFSSSIKGGNPNLKGLGFSYCVFRSKMSGQSPQNNRLTIW